MIASIVSWFTGWIADASQWLIDHPVRFAILAALVISLVVLAFWPRRTPGWVAFCVAVGAAAWMAVSGQSAWVWAGATLALLTLLVMASRQLSKTSLRILTLLALVAGVVLLARIGARTVEEQALQNPDPPISDEVIATVCGIAPGPTADTTETTIADGADEPSEQLTGVACLHAVRQFERDEAALVADDVTRLDAAKVTARIERKLRKVAAAANPATLESALDQAIQAVRSAQQLVSSEALDADLVAAKRALKATRDGEETLREKRADAVAQLQAALATLDKSDAEQAETDAQTALDEAPEPPVDQVSTDLITEGASSVVGTFVDPVVDNPGVRVVLDLLAWVAFILAALLSYRRLELRNNQTYGAPVKLDAIEVGGDSLKKEFLTAGIRARYGSTDLLEPPDTPGGGVIEAVRTTLSEAGGNQGKIAGAFTTLAEKTVFPVAGITVTGTAELVDAPTKPTAEPVPTKVTAPTGGPVTEGAPPAAGAAPAPSRSPEPAKQVHGVVRLETTNERRFIRTEHLRCDTQTQFMAEAAALISADVYSYSYWTPEWARSWGPRGEALAAYRWCLEHPDAEPTEKVRRLRGALAEAPDNGFIRQLLGQQLDLAGAPLEALGVNLANRVDHPRFLNGRYRLVTSLCMMADPERIRAHWLSERSAPDREAILRLAEARKLTAKVARFGGHKWWQVRRWWGASRPASQWLVSARGGVWAGLGVIRGNDASEALLQWARYEANQVRRGYRPWVLLYRAMPQAERHQWLGILRSAPRRRRERDQIRVIQRIIELRMLGASRAGSLLPDDWGAVGKLGEWLDRLVRRGDSSTLALYNTACFWSVAVSLLGEGEAAAAKRTAWLDKAFNALDAAMRGEGGSAPSSAWIVRDPDLAAARRDTARWKPLVRRIEEGEQAGRPSSPPPKPRPAGVEGDLFERWPELTQAWTAALADRAKEGWPAAATPSRVPAGTVAVPYSTPAGAAASPTNGSRIASGLPVVELSVEGRPAATVDALIEALRGPDGLAARASAALDDLALHGRRPALEGGPLTRLTRPLTVAFDSLLSALGDGDENLDGLGATLALVPPVLGGAPLPLLSDALDALPGEDRVILHAAGRLSKDDKARIAELAPGAVTAVCRALASDGPPFVLVLRERLELVTAQPWALRYALDTVGDGPPRVHLEATFVGTFRAKKDAAIGFMRTA